MEVPDEDITAAQLSSSKSSVGRAKLDAATGSRPTAEAEPEGEAADAAAAEEQASDSAATTEHAAPAAEGSSENNTQEARPPASKGGGPPGSSGDKRIPPGAVRMLSMTTVQEFQKKLAERQGRTSHH